MWTEAQLCTLTQRFPLITDNKRLLRADGARDLSDYHYVDFKLTAGILSFPVGLVGLAVVCVREYMFGNVWGCVSMLLEVCKHFRAILNNYCLLLLGATSFGTAKFQLWKTYFLNDHAVQCFQLKIWNLKVLNMFLFFSSLGTGKNKAIPWLNLLASCHLIKWNDSV